MSDGGLVKACNFDLWKGEVLGIAGLVGSGRTELARLIYGADDRSSGTVALDGKPVDTSEPRVSLANGVAYLTEDRKARGLLLQEDLELNTALTVGALSGGARIDRGAEARRFAEAQKRYSIRAASPKVSAGQLSGGNQQKVLFAKTLASDPDLVILDEPTRGVDIGAKSQIYEVIAGLARQGKAVAVISSELPELIGLAHRIMVIDRGRIAGILTPPDGTRPSERAILDLALGLAPQDISR
jgi:ribose transport system ATP-binding protein